MDLLTRLIADRVSSVMGTIGMDSRTLALRTGLPEPVLALRLRAASAFKLDELLRVGGALGCDPVDLLPPFAHSADRVEAAA
ncbi:helix-turn-helix domain-containing protein [Nocardia thailandica]|uniref:helix-turn-helix domain-containing protein n=1 Tax=Nocardia thailandica TaxID=257275 RepID=UPI0012FBF775|nr:helix-turn-helix transcriptional regulator [Nocardia thailandica]